MTDFLPLSPGLYEIGNSLISSLAICLGVILIRFFTVEIYWLGAWAAYSRMRFKLALSIAAIIGGEGAYRMWTWWGRYCANVEANCFWMLTRAWPLVPVFSIAIEVAGMLCMIRILIPDVWGRRSWIVSASLSAGWSFYWYSGRSAVIDFIVSKLF